MMLKYREKLMQWRSRILDLKAEADNELGN